MKKRHISVIFGRLLLVALACFSLVPAFAADTAPIEILRVAPTNIKPGDSIEITLATYGLKDQVNAKTVRVAFGGTVTGVDSARPNRAGYTLVTTVPAQLTPADITFIVVLVDDLRSSRFTDFQVQVDAAEIAGIKPGKADVGESVVLRVSRDLTDEEKLSAYVMFQRERIQPVEITGRDLTIVVPKVETPTPTITLTANGVTSKPYLDFGVSGLGLAITNTDLPRNDNRRVIFFAGFTLMLIAIGVVATARKFRRQHETRLETQINKYRFELETGQTTEVNVDSSTPNAVPEPPPELVAACARGSCVLFAGSGLGSQAGLPTWRDALMAIVHAANENNIHPGDTDWNAVIRLLRGNDVNSVARIIRNTIPQEFIFNVLVKLYSDADNADADICKTLQQIPFSAVIRTSLDEIAETAYLAQQPMLRTPDTPTDLTELNRIDRTSLVIYKLAGTLRESESPKITGGEFRDALRNNQPLTRFLQGKFGVQPFLFLGVSFDSIEQFLSACDVPSGGTTEHFALIPADDDAQTKSAMLSEYGIRFLMYEPTPGFPEFAQFVSKLAERVKQAEIVPASKAAPVRLLSKVTLTNVGPFRFLELDLTSGWNVLLGNNGCGKTTILKSVSAALCGDQDRAKAAIGKLLRHDSDKGEIILDIGDRKYTTSIRREGKRVTVRSLQVTPLEAGVMLVLGFPALRGATFAASSAPSEDQGSSPDMDIGDVLPIVTGEVDSRMDTLRQWIIDTESRGRDSPQYAKLLKSFFHLMDELTPGVKLEFSRIDKSSWTVMVNTDDGEIPIELLSQGMNSIFSWAGYLMQRLQEVYPDSEDLTHEHALVLVDEIDAHMHPKWQQLIVPSLKSAFPNIQFIVTTHSPLITLALDQEEIIVARRARSESDQLQTVTVKRIAIDPSSYQANQLLTSPLFNLDTSGDPVLYKNTLRYTELSAQDSRSSVENTELEALASKIDVRPPAPGEREDARLAWEAIQGAFEDRIKGLTDDQRRRVSQEAKVQLQENITGSRRK